jgi:uncharacterized protein DUF2809
VSRRPVWLSAALIVVTMTAGLAVRFAHLGLLALVVKYGGSALWAMMVYWVVSSLVPMLPVRRAAVVAGIVAILVEFLKLVHTPALEAFRRTLAGVLLLGRIFSFWDIVVYWVAIAVAAGLDWRLRRAR